jgi:hypothetical protein
MDKMKEKYTRQMWNAKRRDIKWDISFEKWSQIWEESGKWEERGRGPGGYVMARKDDTGAYSAENVEIQSLAQNRKAAWKSGRFERKDPFYRVERSHLPDHEQAWYIPGYTWDGEKSVKNT